MSKRQPRVCVLTTSYPRYAGDEASIFVGRMVDAFSRDGMGGSVVVPFDAKELPEEDQGTFSVYRYKYGVFSPGALAFGNGIIPNVRSRPLVLLQAPALLFCMFLKAWKLRNETDVYHANWVVTGLVARALRFCTRKPYVLTLRGEDARLLRSRLFRCLFRKVIGKAAAIISVNEAFLEEIRVNFPKCKGILECIPNGVSLPVISDEERRAFEESLPVPDETGLLLFVGTVTPRKRIDLLISLLAHPDLSEFHLVLCGRTLNEKYLLLLLEQCRILDCRERVHFVGPVSPVWAALYMERADYYVSASEHEGRSNSLLEALASGLPVLVSDIPGHAEVIVDGTNGFLIAEDSFDDAAEIIAELAAEPDMRARIQREARTEAGRWTWEVTAKSYRDLFKRVLE